RCWHITSRQAVFRFISERSGHLATSAFKAGFMSTHPSVSALGPLTPILVGQRASCGLPPVDLGDTVPRLLLRRAGINIQRWKFRDNARHGGLEAGLLPHAWEWHSIPRGAATS